MRHIRSILYSLVLAPAAWVLTAVGLTGDLTARGRDGFAVENVTGLLLLLLAGAAYGILVLGPISPAGPLLAGLAYLAVAVWALLSPSAYAAVWPPEVAKDGFDLSRPGYGLAALLAVPLICTALSARRWEKYEPPVLPLIGQIGRARVQGAPLAAIQTTVITPSPVPHLPNSTTIVVPANEEATADLPPAPTSAAVTRPAPDDELTIALPPPGSVSPVPLSAAPFSADAPSPADQAVVAQSAAAPSTDDETLTVVQPPAGEETVTVVELPANDETATVVEAPAEPATVAAADAPAEDVTHADDEPTADVDGDEPTEAVAEPEATVEAAVAGSDDEPAAAEVSDEEPDPAEAVTVIPLPMADPGERTQVVRLPVGDQAERTQVVRLPVGDAERTQVVRLPVGEPAEVVQLPVGDGESRTQVVPFPPADPDEKTQVIKLPRPGDSTQVLQFPVRSPGAEPGHRTRDLSTRATKDVGGDETQVIRLADKTIDAEKTQVIRPARVSRPGDTTDVLKFRPPAPRNDPPVPSSIVEAESPNFADDPTSPVVPPAEQDEEATQPGKRSMTVLNLERPHDELADDPTRPLDIPTQRRPPDND